MSYYNLLVVGNLKFFRLAFTLANCWIIFLKSKFFSRSFSIVSRAKPLSLSWDMELRKKFLISLSLEKDLSGPFSSYVATVTGTVIYITYAVQYMPYQDKLRQVMHFQQLKKPFLKEILMGNLFSKRRFQSINESFYFCPNQHA